jgi:PAS domain S-box-containing protein
MDELTSEWLSEQIVRESKDAIIFSDTRGIIRLWNAGAEEMLGFPAVEAVGQSLDLIIPENLRARHWEGYFRVMTTGVTKYGIELLSAPGLCRDGSRKSLEFSMIILRDSAGEILGTASVIRDVTAHWEKEKALREQLKQMEASKKG